MLRKPSGATHCHYKNVRILLAQRLDKLSRRKHSMATFSKTRWLLVLCVPALLTSITRGQSPPQVTPQEAGFSSKALEQIDDLLQQAVERKQVAGAVALIARDGKLGYVRAKGAQDVEAGKEMR